MASLSERPLTTTGRSLRRDSAAMRLYEQAKRLGAWNPSAIDFTRDRADWMRLAAAEQDVILRLTAMFQGGEEAVTRDLLPLIMVVAAEGRIEEEIFLTTFLADEAKHTDYFDRFVAEVIGAARRGDLGRYHTPAYVTIFEEALPRALAALIDDPSPAAQVRAAVTYNMIVEGMLAETGYHAYFTMLDRNGIMPGQRQGLLHLQRDEARHIAFGLGFIARHVAADAALWDVVEAEMNDLLLPAMAIIGEVFALYDPMPFGLVEDDFVDYALGQFQKRLGWLERARGAGETAVNRLADGWLADSLT